LHVKAPSRCLLHCSLCALAVHCSACALERLCVGVRVHPPWSACVLECSAFKCLWLGVPMCCLCFECLRTTRHYMCCLCFECLRTTTHYNFECLRTTRHYNACRVQCLCVAVPEHSLRVIPMACTQIATEACTQIVTEACTRALGGRHSAACAIRVMAR